MDLRDKRLWLETHGESYNGHSLDSNNLYFQWISNNDHYDYIKYMPTVEEAMENVFDRVVNDLFELCNQ